MDSQSAIGDYLRSSMRMSSNDSGIHSNPSENEHGLYPIYDVQEVSTPLAESADGFLTQRGDWKKLKELTGDGKGIKVGVGDTGVDPTHRNGDLKGVVDAKDFTGSRYGWHDRHSHGSHCSGHIGARSDNQGMVGLASSCTMFHAKVLGDSGSGSVTGIANGVRWLADQGCHIISLSLGGGYSEAIEGACREVSQQGVFIFAAMGNEGTRGDGHPGNSRYTFGITAVDYQKRLASFSSRSKMAKYSGYGVNVVSCGLNGRYVGMSGTSMACPDQAGLCTLYLSWRAKNGLVLPRTMEELEAMYRPGIEDLGTPGHDVGYGLGFINIWKLLEEPVGTTPEPTTTTTSEPPSPGNSIGMGATFGSDTLLFGAGGEPCVLTTKDKTYTGTVRKF